MEEHARAVPHRWDCEVGDAANGRWTCLACGHVSSDPCDCLCHSLAMAVDQVLDDPREG